MSFDYLRIPKRADHNESETAGNSKRTREISCFLLPILIDDPETAGSRSTVRQLFSSCAKTYAYLARGEGKKVFGRFQRKALSGKNAPFSHGGRPD